MEKTKPIGWLGAVLLAASIGLLFVPGAGVVAPVAAILALLFAPYTEFLGDFTEDKINDIEFRIKENEALGKIIEKLESYAKEKGYDIDYDISRATTLLKKIKLFILSNACKKDEEEIKKYIDELNKAIENIPFFKMLSELHTKWADEQRKGKSGDDTPFCGPNREQIKRFLYGFKKEELLQFGLTDLFRQEVSIETTDAYKNAPYDVQKECKQLWDDLKAIYIEAMLNGVCDTEQKVLVASIALMVTNQVKRVLGEDLHKFAIVVERLEKLLHMNPGGFTLRDVEAGKSFLANYMVNNRCPECGYIGDGVFRDGANGHRLLCAASGVDISFEQYSAPEVYRKYAEMVDTKLNEFKAAYEEHCNKHKEELQLSFDEFKDQIISAFTKLEISQKIRLDEHGESIARLDESVGKLDDKVQQLFTTLTDQLKQHKDDIRVFTEAVNQSREWQQTADVYFKEIFNKLSAGEERLDKIDEPIKELINSQRIDIAALNKDLNKDFNALSRKMDEASQQNTKEHGEIMQQLTQILTDHKNLAARIAIIDGEIIQSKSKGQSNEVEQLSQISATLAEQTARIEGIEGALKTPPQSSQPSDGPYAPTITPSTSGGSSNASKPTVNTSPVSAHPVPTSESRCAYCGAKGRFKAYFDSQRIERSKCKVCGNEFEVDISAGESWRKLYIPYPNGNINNKSLNDGIVYVERAPQHTWRVNGIESVKLIICGPDIDGNLNIAQECLNLILNPITIVYMATGCVGEII